MVPKPDVKWVKQALERLQIRVVNDRPGRRKKEQVIKEREEKQQKRMISSAGAGDQLYQPGSGGRGFSAGASMDQGAASQMASAMVPPALMSGGLSDPALGANAASLGFPNALPNSNFPSMPNASTQMGRRLSNDIASYSRRSSVDRSAFNTSNPGMGLDDFQRSAALQGLPQAGIAGLPTGSVIGNLAQELGHVPSPSRRHYHVLKEHHDNLLKELQQTTYMMEMYQNTNFEDEPDNANMMGMNSMLQSPLHDMNMNMDQRRPSFDSRRLSLSMNNPALGSALPYDFATSNRRDSLGMNEFQSRRDSLAALSGMNQMNAAMGRPGGAFNQNPQFHLSNPGMMNQGSYGAGHGQGRNMMHNASATDSGRRPSPGSSEAQSSAKRTKLSDNAGNKA